MCTPVFIMHGNRERGALQHSYTMYNDGGLQGTMLMKLELATIVSCCKATEGGFAFGDFL